MALMQILCLFPRSHERGPIEAVLIGSDDVAAMRTFRVHTNAAPLKRKPHLRSVGPSPSFPRSHERGPIEANRRHIHG